MLLSFPYLPDVRSTYHIVPVAHTPSAVLADSILLAVVGIPGLVVLVAGIAVAGSSHRLAVRAPVLES